MAFIHGLKLSKQVPPFLSRYFQISSIFSMDTKVEKSNCSNIVWLDMEMTGLDISTSHILEVACLITDRNLKVISEDLNIVIHQSDEILDNMNDWCLINHKKTGLIDESRLSQITTNDAEEIVLKYLKRYTEEKACPLAGSSVYVDRMFLCKYMPLINNYLNYRIIDTSTIKELIKRWNTNVPVLQKRHDHRALLDIKESIRELKCYKQYIFDLCVKS
ncbi:Probable oligoribonuclease [Anthophora quadrimaculata]